MAPKTYGDEDDEPEVPYHESSDDDFDPESAPADDGASSSEDEEDATAPAAPKGKRKRKAPVDDELDSGDEVTIEAARKRSRKSKKGGKDGHDHVLLSEDEGGEGGLIKTRAQRAVEKKERRPLARIEGATVDVEALWAQMTAAPLRPVQPEPLPSASTAQDAAAPAVTQTADAPVEEELVTLTKTFVFAGQNTTEEKQIPRSLLENHTADGWKPVTATKAAGTTQTTASKNADPKVRRPLRRPSRFDPNPTGYVRALAPEHQLSWPRKTTASAAPPPPESLLDGAKKPEKATKLNVVAKSRMDWTGFVDKEGIAAELQEHGKSKDNYMSRRDFLAGVEARMEEEGRKGRVANATALT